MKKYSLLSVTLLIALVFGRLVMNFNERYESSAGTVTLEHGVKEDSLAKAIMLKNYLPEMEDARFAAKHICSRLAENEPLSSLYDLNKRDWKIPADSIDKSSAYYYNLLVDEQRRMGVDQEFKALNISGLPTAAVISSGEKGSISVFVKSKDENAGTVSAMLGLDKKPCADVVVRLEEHYIDSLYGPQTKILAHAKTDASGQAVFKGLTLSSSYSVVPIKEGYEFGATQGTLGGSLGEVGDDGALECTFIENKHCIKVFNTLTLRNIKSDHVISVRTLNDFYNTMLIYVGLFVAAWWILFLFYKRRHRGADGTIIALMMALTGICLVMMFSMNDPLNDKLIGVDMAQGVLAGVFVMLLLQTVDFKAFYQDRSFIPFDIPAALIKWFFKPYRLKVARQTKVLSDASLNSVRKLFALLPIVLCLPFLILDLLQLTRLYPKIDSLFARLPKGVGYMLAAVLLTMLLFTPLGVAVGGMKVNLNIGFIFQPSEIAKYLIVIFMAAFFCSNADTIVKFSQKGNVGLFGVKLRMLGGIILGLGFLMGMYLLLGDMGPSMVLAFTFIIMYSVIKSKVDIEGIEENNQLKHILTCDLAMLLYGVGSFILMVYVGSRFDLMWLFCIAWFALWIGIGLIKKRIFESAIVFNLIIAAFIFGGSIMGAIPGLDSVADRLESRNEMCTNTWGVLPVDGAQADPGENTQVAEGLWGLATGGFAGQGVGKSSPNVIPAFHTDMILTSIGEQFGLLGLIVVVVLLSLLLRRTIVHGYSSANPFAFYICMGIAVVTGVQFVIIALGCTGIIPLTGVTVPFFSFGKVSMILNLAAFGIVLSISGRNSDVVREDAEIVEMRRRQMARYDYSISIVSLMFVAITVFIVGVFSNYTIFERDETLIRPVYVNNQNGMPVVDYNPRIAMASQKMPIGKITDRNGVLLASSNPDDIILNRKEYMKMGVDSATFENHMKARLRRYYPFGDHLFFMLGDYNTRLFFTSSSGRGYIAEEKHLSELRGYNDRLQEDGEFVKVNLQSDEYRPGKYFNNDSTYTIEDFQLRDYSALIPALKTGEPIGTTPQNIQLTLDAELQVKIQNALKAHVDGYSFKKKNLTRISAVVLDARNGDMLASAMYPVPDQNVLMSLSDSELNRYSDNKRKDDWRAYSDMDLGLVYQTPPGSTAKVLTSMAALKKEGIDVTEKRIWVDKDEIIYKRKDYSEPGDLYLDMKNGLRYSSNPFFIHLLNSCDLYEPLVNIYYSIGCQIDGIAPEYLAKKDRESWVEGALQLSSKAVSRYERYISSDKKMKLNDGSFPTCWAWAWGQGGQNTLKAAPVAMARGVSIVANDGYLTETRFLKNESVKRTEILPEEEVEALFGMLKNNVAHYGSFKNYDGKENIGGKTGTPERELDGVIVNDGWFLCFVDSAYIDGNKKTSLAVAVRVERGSSSGGAAGVAKDVVLPVLEDLEYIR